MKKISLAKMASSVTFNIYVDDKLCRVYLYPDGLIRYNEQDFRQIRYKNIDEMRSILDHVESRIKNTLRKSCFTK
jgi:hypothetical protein